VWHTKQWAKKLTCRFNRRSSLFGNSKKQISCQMRGQLSGFIWLRGCKSGGMELVKFQNFFNPIRAR